MITVAAAEQATGIEVLDHLERQAEVPVICGLQRQGDVLVIPHRMGASKGEAVPAEGIPVVRGEAGGNTHALMVYEGTAFWRPLTALTADLGELTVPEGSVVMLGHPEHGFLGIGPGTYGLRRQQEQADVARLVAD
jgi:hypothetical protein